MTSAEPEFPSPPDEHAKKSQERALRQGSWGDLELDMLAAVLVYFAAFALPVFDNSNAHPGHMVIQPTGLVLGYRAFVWGIFFPVGWSANLVFWCGLVLLVAGRSRAAGILGVVASLLGMSYLVFLSDATQDPLIHERRFLAGYFVWLASLGLLAGIGFGRWKLRSVGRASVAGACGSALVVIVAVAGQAAIVRVYHPPTAAELRAGLGAATPEERRRAASGLVFSPTAESVPALRRALHDSDDEVRGNAIQALAAIGAPAKVAIPDLIAILENPTMGALRGDPRVPPQEMVTSRSSAAGALGELGPEAKVAIPALTAALKDQNVVVRRWAAYSLAKLVGRGESVSPSVLETLKDPDLQVRRNAIEILKGRHGAPEVVVPALIAISKDPDSGIRHAAVDLLGDYARQAPELVLPPLAAIAANPADFDQGAAIQALAKVGPSAAPALVAALKGGWGPAPRWAAASLQKLGVPEGGWGPEPGLAAASLQKIGAPAVAPLLDALPGADAGLRREIYHIFSIMGPKAAAAASTLEAAAENDPDPRTRDMANYALGKIDPKKAWEIYMRQSKPKRGQAENGDGGKGAISP